MRYFVVILLLLAGCADNEVAPTRLQSRVVPPDEIAVATATPTPVPSPAKDEPSVLGKIFHGIGKILGGAGQGLQNAAADPSTTSTPPPRTCTSQVIGNQIYTNCP